MCIRDREVNSLESFFEWKQETEKETFSRYVKKRGSHSATDSTKRHYYICHRSGQFVSESKGSRHLKLQGSNKINAVCPASIRVTETEDGTCKITCV